MILMSKKTGTFISSVSSGCLSLWGLYGILPSVACAQAALESGWGTSTLAVKYFNLFGIKGEYNNTSVVLPTTEYYDSETVISIIDNFRVYPNWNVSILDYGTLLAINSRYTAALNITDYKKQIQAIYDGGYATDPNYVSKIVSIIKNYDLVTLDDEAMDALYYPIPDYTGSSVVDALKASELENPNFDLRAKIAVVNKIVSSAKEYTGSSQQNLTLLELLMSGKLKRII